MHRHEPVRICNETKDVDPMTRLPADAPATQKDEPKRRRSCIREGIVSVETQIGSQIRETKYATQDTEVFGTKDIRREILPRGNPSINPDLSTVHRFAPPTVLSVVNTTGGALPGDSFRHKDMIADMLQREKRQCAGLGDDKTVKRADIEKTKESGLFTLYFTNSKRKGTRLPWRSSRSTASCPPSSAGG